MKSKKEAEAKEPAPPPPPKTKKKAKRKKDPTEKESVEALTKELVTEGIMLVCPKRSFDEYICQDYLRGVEPNPIKDWLIDNSMAQVLIFLYNFEHKSTFLCSKIFTLFY
jgi:hypothetical protein